MIIAPLGLDLHFHSVVVKANSDVLGHIDYYLLVIMVSLSSSHLLFSLMVLEHNWAQLSASCLSCLM